MNVFVEENKGLLRKCYVCANALGWVTLVLGWIAVFANIFALGTRLGDWEVFREFYFKSVPWGTINCLPIGFLALGIAQFIKFICEKDYQPGRVLRNADKLIYTYAVLFVVSVVIYFIANFSHWDSWAEIIVRTAGYVVWGIGKTMLLIAVALILKRIIPVIEESKTLV